MAYVSQVTPSMPLAPWLSQTLGSKRPVSSDFSPLSGRFPSAGNFSLMPLFVLSSPSHCHALPRCHTLVTPHLQASWLQQASKEASDFQNKQQILKPKKPVLMQRSLIKFICIEESLNLCKSFNPSINDIFFMSLQNRKIKNMSLQNRKIKKYVIDGGTVKVKWDDNYKKHVVRHKTLCNDDNVSHYRHLSDTQKHRSEHGTLFCRTVRWFPNDCRMKSKFFAKVLHNLVPTTFPDPLLLTQPNQPSRVSSILLTNATVKN